LGARKVQYKLRDWLFSRQRYWGEPFPIVWRDGRHEGLPASALPVMPPDLDDYKPTASGEPPLARARGWVELPDGALRETNTMPQWAGSCWYYLRYLDARNGQAFCDREAERYWMGTTGSPDRTTTPGVDLYVGGTEHAVLHLLYARFWHKVLFDLGWVSTPEPFFKLVNQGLILGEMEFTAFADADGRWSSAAEVAEIAEEATPQGPRLCGTHKATGQKVFGHRVTEDDIEKHGDGFRLKTQPGIRVDARSFKMSKSRGNVINPDDILDEYGADAFRLYEMFLGPLEMVKPWSTRGVEGVYRFLGRVWRLFVDEVSDREFQQALTTDTTGGVAPLALLRLDASIQDVAPTRQQLKAIHGCIKKVTEDLEGLRFNTAISALMVFVNEAMGWAAKPRSALRSFLLLLQPFAPHLAEELFGRLEAAALAGRSEAARTMAYEPWPAYDPAVLAEDTLELPVQVNGKLRDRVCVPASATTAEIERAALQCEKAIQFIAGRPVRKVFVVPKRLVNVVTA
jgi:leucyl-tRNA synthetase